MSHSPTKIAQARILVRSRLQEMQERVSDLSDGDRNRKERSPEEIMLQN